MRTRRFHGLKRPKIRQSLNKYNLYNLSRAKPLRTAALTYFQQKWKAKAESRAYHGEQIREGQWEQMFSSKIRSVIPMDHRYLAWCDGSEQAEGRGSGKQTDPNQVREQAKNRREPTPYMQMTYAPTERRLDTAIFRALFASSARQARQFVIHGKVRVNGHKMIYPGYLLNPGDMFQVEPESVLFALGAPKERSEIRLERGYKKKQAQRAAGELKGEERSDETAVDDETPETSSSEKKSDQEEVEATEAEQREGHKDRLQSLLENAKSILTDKRDVPSAKRRTAIREFTRTVRRTIGQVKRSPLENLDNELASLVSKLSLVSKPARETEEQHAEQTTASSSEQSLTRDERAMLKEAMRQARENPVDLSKPYHTPWRPRMYLSPFAFIPRYLEVNQNICSAVYLRHPVARPGLAEVPTPFHPETSQLAFNWYLRRR